MTKIAVLCIALTLGLSGVARAQGAPQITAEAEPSTVGVGDIVQLVLSATSGEVLPADPQPGPTPGFVVRGVSGSPSQAHIIINGSRTDRYTLTTTWAIQAKRVGTFRIGPPSIVVGGTRYTSRVLTVTVVPAGQAPRAAASPSPFPQFGQNPFGPSSPFDLWKGLVPGMDIDNPMQPPQTITHDPKLSLDAPRGSFYFLHATVDRTTAVVGEQVTFSVFEYIDAGATRVEVNEEDVHDATAADFVKHPLMHEDQEVPVLGYAAVGGRTWVVKLVRRWALFPIRSGDLVIGPMHVSLLRPQDPAGPTRASETLHVRVAEPPLIGRPPGYVLGDVGRFSLTAQVSPREVEQDGAIGVHVEVSGTGNLPSAIATPAREGTDWLAPETHDELGPTGRDAFGGKRTFDFVVRVRRAGQVDMGDLTLPFWDPEAKKYQIARASLGVIRVARSATGNRASEDKTQDILPGLPAPRDALEGSRGARTHPDDSPLFWVAGIGAWPLAFGVAAVGRGAALRIANARRTRRASPAKELRQRLAAARTACHAEDARTADAAIARALEAATVAHAGINIRGVMAGEVLDRLERAGVDRAAASSIADLLRECEAARFAPDAADISAARNRWHRAQGAIRGLERSA
ncbi:MAG: BatD family protein [Myxococcota bacterium]|nr:BatD family protein [Myxococcota bacterium]